MYEHTINGDIYILSKKAKISVIVDTLELFELFIKSIIIGRRMLKVNAAYTNGRLLKSLPPLLLIVVKCGAKMP